MPGAQVTTLAEGDHNANLKEMGQQDPSRFEALTQVGAKS
jgi:hypothetical protein